MPWIKLYKSDRIKASDAAAAGVRHPVWKIILCGFLAIAAQGAYATSFVDTLNTDPTGGSPVTSFTRTLGGVSFTYTFTVQGDGGDIVWQNQYGEGNSASVNLESGTFNTGTTERVTITRSDAADFTFNSIYMDNTGGQTVTVGGYLNGTLVGSTQTVPNGVAGTLNFGGIGVDEVRISATDMINTNIDSFTGDTTPPDSTPPIFQNSTPSLSGTTPTQTTLTVQLDETGTAYYVVVPDGAGAPSSLQVKAGQDSGGSAAIKNGSISVTSGGTAFNTNITGLSAGTAYDVYVVAEDSVPNLQASPTLVNLTTQSPDADGSLTPAGGVTEPVGLPTTATSAGAAIDVLDFTLSDGGTADGQPMTISQIVLHVSGTTTDTERGQITWRLNGPDASNVTGSYSAGSDTLTFSGLSISIADGNTTGETYTVNAYYNDNTGITEDHTFVLSVDGDTDVTTGANGTQMGATSAVDNAAGGATLDVTATKLAFTTQPSGSVSGSALVTQPVVAAQDAAGNTDVDFTETVTLTEASAGTLSGNTKAAVAGVATFTGLTYIATADQQSFTLTANDQDGIGSDLPTAMSNLTTSDVVATKLIFSTQPAPTSVADGVASAFSTVPVVQATDALNVVDTGYSTGITLSEVNGAGSATMSGTGDTDGSATTVTITPSSGVSTFTGLQVTYNNSAGNETFNLRASSGGLTAADSSTLTSYAAPTVSDGNISISGATGNAGAFRIGDTVTATWNNTGSGDNNPGITGVTVNFSQFGGGSAVAASNSSGTWTATYTIVSGSIDATNRNVSVTASNAGNSATTADTTNATVDNITATVNSVSVPANATYIGGQNLNFIVNYSEAVTVNTGGGTPRLVLTIGSSTRYATYLSGSGTSALMFRYTVQSGDADSDGIALNATLNTNGGTLADGAGNSASTALNSIGSLTSVLVDAQAPSVSSVTAPSNGTYLAGQNANFVVNVSESATVNTTGGTPRLVLTVGATTRYANFLSNLSPSQLVFRYTVQSGDADSDGIAVGSTLDLNGGTIRDNAGNDLNTTLNSVGSTTGVLIDGKAPSVNSVTLPANASYMAGQNLDFTVNYDEAVTVSTAGGTPRLTLSIGSTTRYATYISGSGTSALLFRYTVQSGDTDSDGIALSTTLDTNGGTLRDGSGNNASTSLGTLGSLAGVKVDTQAPSINSATLPANATYISGQNLDFTVNYDESVIVNTGGGTPRLVLTIGADTRYATYLSGSGSSALLFRYTAQAGDVDSDGIGLSATLDTNGGTIRDAAANNASTSLGALGSLAGVLVDAQAPSVSSVTLPADGRYNDGDNLDFTVNYDDNVTVSTVGGTPRLVLTIGSTTRYASYISGSGSTALVFRYTVVTGDKDGDGITLSTTIDTNGGTLHDASGNNASTSLGAIASLANVLVNDYRDTTPPAVTAPADLLLDAGGLYTKVTLRQLLGLAADATDTQVQSAMDALATDNVDGTNCCDTHIITLSSNGGTAKATSGNSWQLPPGNNVFTWQGTDKKGNNGSDTQTVQIRPLVSLSKDQIGVEGAAVSFKVLLNGPALAYPYSVPFTIDAASTATSADHDLVAGNATINAGLQTSVTVNLVDDSPLADDGETLIIDLDTGSVNAGAKIKHTITISEGNVAPVVDLAMRQAAVDTVLVAANGGNVTVTANVTDQNATDTHSFDWSNTSSQLIDTDGDTTDNTFVFDPSSLTAGVYTMHVFVADNHDASDTAELSFRVVPTAPVLSPSADSDGDGTDDQTEGTGDSDGDGIPDYLDNIAATNVLPENADVTDAYLIECDPGVLCRLGRTALAGSGGGAQIDASAVSDDTGHTHSGGLFDFELHELPEAGQTVKIVLPQTAPVPADAVYRKFNNDVWSDFVEDANNAVYSAPGAAGFCPPPGDTGWQAGLNQGDYCVLLTIEDGGPNDADGLANGSVKDPGGVAVAAASGSGSGGGTTVTVHTTVKSGGGALGWPTLLILGLMILLNGRLREGWPTIAVAALLTLPVPQSQGADSQPNENQPARARATPDHTAQFNASMDKMEDSRTALNGGDWKRRLLKNSYIELGLYQANSTQSRGDLVNGLTDAGVTANVQGYDTTRFAYQLLVGYRYYPHLAVEVGYLDLGDINVDMTATAPDSTTLSRAMSDNYPRTGSGWTVSNRFDYDLNGRLGAGAEVGLYHWDGKIDVSGANLNPDVSGGTDPLLGLSLRYTLAEHYSLQLKYQRLLLSGQDVNLWGGGFGYSF